MSQTGAQVQDAVAVSCERSAPSLRRVRTLQDCLGAAEPFHSREWKSALNGW